MTAPQYLVNCFCFYHPQSDKLDDNIMKQYLCEQQNVFNLINNLEDQEQTIEVKKQLEELNEKYDNYNRLMSPIKPNCNMCIKYGNSARKVYTRYFDICDKCYAQPHIRCPKCNPFYRSPFNNGKSFGWIIKKNPDEYKDTLDTNPDDYKNLNLKN
jgi:hypothetical protein